MFDPNPYQMLKRIRIEMNMTNPDKKVNFPPASAPPPSAIKYPGYSLQGYTVCYYRKKLCVISCPWFLY